MLDMLDADSNPVMVTTFLDLFHKNRIDRNIFTILPDSFIPESSMSGDSEKAPERFFIVKVKGRLH